MAKRSCSHGNNRVHAPAGFTLLELLVVMAILALLLTVVPPLVRGPMGTAELKSAVRQMAAGLRSARSQAIARNREAVFELDLEARRFRISGTQRTFQLPRRLALRLYAARSEFSNAQTGAIRFFPDGSSTGGRVTVSLDPRAYEVDVNWLTGRVTVYD